MTKPLKHLVIEGAIDIISDRKKWTDGYEARDADGYDAPFHSEDAVSFCAIGAIKRSALDLGVPRADAHRLGEEFSDDFLRKCGEAIECINDCRRYNGRISIRIGRTNVIKALRKYLMD